MVSNFPPTTPAQKAGNEYKEALYKAAAKAANIVETALAPRDDGYIAVEKAQIDLALKLLAIVQGVPLPEK